MSSTHTPLTSAPSVHGRYVSEYSVSPSWPLPRERASNEKAAKIVAWVSASATYASPRAALSARSSFSNLFVGTSKVSSK